MTVADDILTSLVRREALEAREAQWLAPYAMKSRDTRGRQHPELEDPHRTVYRRDRDRVIHSSAFRRLECKTQVFANLEGDYYRTRLTHTIEVAQIALSVARILRLNEDLVEVIALAHDLGHPPFGHAGEDALRHLMKDHGGFEHNLQGLRIVDVLERRYPNFPGLNLSWEVREGLNKHRIRGDPGGLAAGLDPSGSPLLEAQLADVADEIAYDNHDLDDGLTSGILREEGLAGVELWSLAGERVRSRGGPSSPEVYKYQVIRTLINEQVTDLVQSTAERLARCRIDSVEAVRSCPERLVDFSEGMRRMRGPLKDHLWRGLYGHYRIARMADKAKRFITDLFNLYVKNPDQLPNTTRLRIERGEAPARVVCDYVAGMTDRYCLQEYQKLFDPNQRV